MVLVENNVRVAVYDLNPNGKKAVVMIHGWPLAGEIFEYQQEMLVNNGYRVVTIDLRGFGNSDVTADGYTYDQFAIDLFHIVRNLNLNNFILAGFSMGGGIALRYMNLCNGYGVNKLCLLGAAAPSFTRRPGFPYGVTPESVNQLIMQAAADRADLCANFSRRLLNTQHSDAIKDWFGKIALQASGIGTILAAYSLRDEDCRPDMSSVHVPTGIFHGQKDVIVPFELGVLQHETIPHSDFYPFENSGHAIFYDELPLFNQLFLEFLEK